MSDLIPRHMAVAACAIGPSDEWSKSTRSGYEQAALDCVMNILRIESEPSPALSALAMRERAAGACDNQRGILWSWPEQSACDDCAAVIRALPPTFTDAELLAAAMQLPEVRALVEALDDMRDYGTVLADKKYHHNLAAALAPFTKGGEK